MYHQVITILLTILLQIWALHRPHEYCVIDHYETWRNAKTYCERLYEKGSLVCVNTPEELELVKAEVSIRLDANNYWVGGFYDKHKKTWMWVDGTEVMSWPTIPMTHGEWTLNTNGTSHRRLMLETEEYNFRVDVGKTRKKFICEQPVNSTHGNLLVLQS